MNTTGRYIMGCANRIGRELTPSEIVFALQTLREEHMKAISEIETEMTKQLERHHDNGTSEEKRNL